MNDANPKMSEPKNCPQCGTALKNPALGGLCPACLLAQGANDSVTEPRQPRVHTPTVVELASLFPQLDILELIGKGGMGAVYKARQKELDRIVALKILQPGVGEAAGFAERFTREARALAKLNHPNIVTIHDFGRADGLFYFVMEFVDGVTLRQLLHGNRISPHEALAIVPQICEALQFAHDHGIVHRDIKRIEPPSRKEMMFAWMKSFCARWRKNRNCGISRQACSRRVPSRSLEGRRRRFD